MVEYNIQHDFSELEAKTELGITEKRIASKFGERQLYGAELKEIATSDGKALAVMLSYTETTCGIRVSHVEVTPAPGSSITNIDYIMKVLLQEKEKIAIHPVTKPETVVFTKHYPYGDVTYHISTRTPPSVVETKDLHPQAEVQEAKLTPEHKPLEELVIRSTMTPEEMRAAVADLDDSIDKGFSPPTAVEQATKPAGEEKKEVPIPTPVPEPLEDIAGYCIVGEREEGRFYGTSDIEHVSSITDLLQYAILTIQTSSGENPLLAYTMSGDAATKVDIFPPKGARITNVVPSNDAKPLKEQKRGMIRYTIEGTEIVIHRRHPDEKYDIRGEMNTSGNFGGQIMSQAEAEEVRQMANGLPIIIRSSDDTEVNVVRQQYFSTFRIMFSPKETASLYIVGLESAEKEKFARPRSHSPRIKNIEITRKGADTSLAAVVFTTTSNSIKDWENKGGVSEKDLFDRFYEQHQEMHKKG